MVKRNSKGSINLNIKSEYNYNNCVLLRYSERLRFIDL